MNERQEKASEQLGRAVMEVVESGQFGVAQMTQSRSFVNGEMTSFMVVVFANSQEVLNAVKHRAVTPALGERPLFADNVHF